MGEWSKTIGEYGEETVSNFLKLIGWAEAPRNIPVDCLKVKEHAAKSETRQTHGIDFFFSYLSPLADNTLKKIYISSKYTTLVYPTSPNSKFHEYVKELCWTIECFRFSKKNSELISSFKGYNHIDEEGVIFWLSNDENTYDDLIQKLRTTNTVLDGPIKNLYLVDNKKISFITSAIRYVQLKYPNQKIDFYYQNTGKNINPTYSKDFGKTLPVEFLTANILPIRTEDLEGKSGLVLCSTDSFSKTDLKRLIGLAKELTKSWTGAIDISFPDFDTLSHEPEVREVKSDFSNSFSTENLVVTSYTPSFKSIN